MKVIKTALAQRFLTTLNTAVGLGLYFCLMACNLRLAPVPEPPEVIGPDQFQQRYNPVTADQVVNFFSREKIQENAKQQLDRVIRYARADGRKVMRRGDKNKNYQRLAVIFDRVMAASHLAGSQIEPIVIDRPQFQAKTYGGEAVIFYTGLTQALPDDELAFVVAHELAHIAAGHI